MDWAEALIGGDTGDFVDGMAFHWYSGNDDRLMDGTYGYDRVNATHSFAPGKILLATEGCSCPGVRLGDWLRAERLIHDIIFDVNSFAQGWIDWNLLVNSEGGPNHLKNYCDASIVTLPGYSDIYVQPKFYYMAHISKFVPPNSVRIRSSIVGNFRFANIDPGVRAGLELGAYPCEMSTRQLWLIDGNGSFRLWKRAVDTESAVGEMKELCVSGGDSWRNYLKLMECSSTKDRPLQLNVSSDGTLRDAESGLCVDLADGVLDAGAILHLTSCSGKVTQQFTVDTDSGEIKSVPTGYCLTAGWPFLYATAFQDPSKQTVVIIVNEAPVDTSLILSDERFGMLSSGINALSVQTVVY